DGKVDLAVANGYTANNVLLLAGATIPVISANASFTTICAGSPTTLSGSGATTYSWQPGSLSGNPVVSPTGSTLYTVTGYTASGCGNVATVQINVNTAPAQPGSITGSAAICSATSNIYNI